MIYPYICHACGAYEEVIKSTALYQSIEICKMCGGELQKVFTTFHFSGAKRFEPHYQPAFGKVVYNKHQIKEECNIRECVEVGSETSDNYAKHSETIIDNKIKQSWEGV